MTKNITSERVRLGLTQNELADKIGVHVNTVRSWECGTSKPGSLKLISLCEIFGCSADYLLGISEERL